jgi:hypothetical protein
LSEAVFSVDFFCKRFATIEKQRERGGSFLQFYTYAYLQSQAQVSYLFQYGLIFFILVALVIITAKYMRNRLQSKYRDLSIILLLIGLFLIGSNWDSYSRQRETRENTSRMMQFLDTFSDNMTLSESDIAVNSLRLQDGMLIKIRDDYYRIDFNSSYTAYRINRVYLIQKDVKLVDVPH